MRWGGAVIMAGIIFIVMWTAKTPGQDRLRCPELRLGVRDRDSDHRSRSQQSVTPEWSQSPPAPGSERTSIVWQTWWNTSWEELRLKPYQGLTWRGGSLCDLRLADDGQAEASGGGARHPGALSAGGDVRPVSVPRGVAGGVASPRTWWAPQCHRRQHRHQGGVTHIIRPESVFGSDRSLRS